MAKAGDFDTYGLSDHDDDEDDFVMDYEDDGPFEVEQDSRGAPVEDYQSYTISGKFSDEEDVPSERFTIPKRDDTSDNGTPEGWSASPDQDGFSLKGLFKKKDDISGPRRRDPEDPSSRLKLMNKKKVAAGVVVGLIVLGLAWSEFGGGGDSDNAEGPETDIVSSTESEAFDPNDPPGPVKDNRNGNHDTAVNAIRGYLWEYYINKDAEAARSYYSDDAPIEVSDIQEGIDNTVPDLRYNVLITPTGSEVYDVTLTLLTPDGKSQDYAQQYTMTKEHNQFYIQRFTSS